MRVSAFLVAVLLLAARVELAEATPLTAGAQALFSTPGCDCSFGLAAPEVNTIGETHPALADVDFMGWHAHGASWFGVLSASASVVGTVFPLGVNHRSVSHAYASWMDTFLIEGGSGTGTFQLSLRLDGFLSGDPSANPQAFRATFVMADDPFQGSLIKTYTAVGTGPGPIDEMLLYAHSFVYGVPFTIGASIDVRAEAFLGQASDANFGSTARILGAVVRDSDGNIVDAPIHTTSGVDFNDLASFSFTIVPEPSSIALLAAGFLFLGVGRARRRARH